MPNIIDDPILKIKKGHLVAILINADLVRSSLVTVYQSAEDRDALKILKKLDEKSPHIQQALKAIFALLDDVADLNSESASG